MRAVRFYEYGGPEVLRLEEVPAPVPADGEVLLKVFATSIRRNDATMRAGQEGYFRVPLSFQLGRESSGVVAALGAGVTAWKEGDEAITRNITPCGSCDNCRTDLGEMCRSPRYQGVSSWGDTPPTLRFLRAVSSESRVRLPMIKRRRFKEALSLHGTI